MSLTYAQAEAAQIDVLIQQHQDEIARLEGVKADWLAQDEPTPEVETPEPVEVQEEITETETPAEETQTEEVAEETEESTEEETPAEESKTTSKRGSAKKGK